MSRLKKLIAAIPTYLITGDDPIGGVEVKDENLDIRANVNVVTALTEAHNALAVQAPVLGVTTGSALNADGPGTLQQYFRGLLKTALGEGMSEVILHSQQLVDGAAGGVAQAISFYIGGNPVAGTDDFTITDGTVTETWAFEVARTAPFEVEVGIDASTTMANLVAAIVADSTLWTAANTANLAPLFAGAPVGQALVYRQIPANEDDRIYGVITVAGSFRVSTPGADYTPVRSVEADLPAVDPGVKTFGFGRVAADCAVGESHRDIEFGGNHLWTVGQTWLAIDDLGLVLAAIAANVASIDAKTPADPAREGGNLSTIAGDTTSLDGKVPTLGQSFPVSANARTETLSAAAVNCAVLGDNSLIAAVALQTIRVYRIILVFDGAAEATFYDGAAGTALTGPMSMAAGGSFTLDFDGEPWFTCTVNTALVLNLSAAVQVSGRVYYTQA